MRFAVAIAVLLIAVVPVATASGESWPVYEIIVNPTTDVGVVDRKLVADAFLKKVTRWSDDAPIRPVDQAADSPLRQQFSNAVLRRSVDAVKSYWQQLIFSGRGLPPPEVSDDAQVVAYVVGHPGALGYVAVGTKLQGAKVLTLR